ncbi:hypothetical protein B0H17DRAFT_1130683 [Mycena rosella]|uniref:Uncharacterized protein n=1 Tax=Mycena rosella TaxID=1033263 RepID=A0AAD7DT32_MYCRO|nr:hypothetical protein B0H17DRAFT_1130683 [Mycena rosella]
MKLGPIFVKQYLIWTLKNLWCPLNCWSKRRKYLRPKMGRIDYGQPSTCDLAMRLNRYTPVIWRGRNPDKHKEHERPRSLIEHGWKIPGPKLWLVSKGGTMNIQHHWQKRFLVYAILWTSYAIAELLSDEIYTATVTRFEEVKTTLHNSFLKKMPRMTRLLCFFPEVSGQERELWRSLLDRIPETVTFEQLEEVVKELETTLKHLIPILNKLLSQWPTPLISSVQIAESSSCGSRVSDPSSRSPVSKPLESKQQCLGNFLSGVPEMFHPKQTKADGYKKQTLAHFLTGSTPLGRPGAASGEKNVAGVSKKLADFGVMRNEMEKGHVLTDEDVGTSVFMWPSPLFPVLNDANWDPSEAMDETGMELISVDFDPRDFVLNLKTSFLEVEPLLHCSPQIFTKDEWIGVARTPKNKHGFKVVMSLEMRTHVLVFLAKDNNARFQDIVFDHWAWSEFTVKYWRSRGTKNDKKSVGSVIGAAGNQPFRGIECYLRNENLNLAGLHIWDMVLNSANNVLRNSARNSIGNDTEGPENEAGKREFPFDDNNKRHPEAYCGAYSNPKNNT